MAQIAKSSAPLKVSLARVANYSNYTKIGLFLSLFMIFGVVGGMVFHAFASGAPLMGR
jgi:hypothetical protein